LLHAAVKSAAEKLEKVDRAAGISEVAKSMVVTIMDAAEAEKDAEVKAMALDSLVLYMTSVQQLWEELAPDVEPEKVTYQGSLKPKKLEELYVSHLDRFMAEAAEQSAMAMAAMFGQSADADMARMEAKLATSEKRRAALASLCGLSSEKAEKLFEKKQQQELMGSLGGLGGLGGLGDMAKLMGDLGKS